MKKIHTLINTLSGSEKRMFKLRLTNNKKDSYISKLFDIINSQNEYNFDKIALSGGRSAKQTRANLTLLYDFILRFLRECDISENVRVQCRGELMDIITLEERGLISDAITKARKLSDKSIELENYEAAHDTLNELWRLLVINNTTKAEDFSEVQHLIDEVKTKIQELYNYQQVYRKVSSLYIDYFYFKRNLNAVLLVNSALLEISQYKKSFSRAAYKHYEIQAMSYLIKEDYELALLARKTQLRIVFSSPAYQNKYIEKIHVLGHILQSFKIHFQLNQFKEYFSLFIKHLSPTITKIKDTFTIEKYHEYYLINQCFLLITDFNFFSLTTIKSEIETAIKNKIVRNPNHLLNIYLSLIEVLIIHKQFKEATKYFMLSFQLKDISKTGILYNNLELLFIFQKIILNDLDYASRLITSYESKIRRHHIETSIDKTIFLEFLKDLNKDKVKDLNYYIEQINVNYGFKILLKSLKQIRLKSQTSFTLEGNDNNYKKSSDVLLQNIINN